MRTKKGIYKRRRIIFLVLMVLEILMLVNSICGAKVREGKIEQAKASIQEIANEYNETHWSIEKNAGITRQLDEDKRLYFDSKNFKVVATDIVAVDYPATFNGLTLRVRLNNPNYVSLVWNKTVWCIVIIFATFALLVAYSNFKKYKK